MHQWPPHDKTNRVDCACMVNTLILFFYLFNVWQGGGSLLQLSEGKSCRIWLGCRINVAEANLGGGQGLLAYPGFLFSRPFSGRSPDIVNYC